jgi:protoheme IX farnesyltransferase
MVPFTASAGTGQDLLMVMAVLGLWQMPHFLVLRAGVQISDGGESENSLRAMDRRDGMDEKSGFRPPPSSVFPCMARGWTPTELQVQVLIWVSLYSLAMLWFLLHGGIASAVGSMALGGMALALPAGMAWLQLQCRSRSGTAGFVVINLSLFVFMMLGILDRAATGFFPFQ